MIFSISTVARWGLFFLLLSMLAAGCNDLDEPGNLVPATADQDPSLPQIALNGCAFHLQTFGAEGRPVVVFLPGGLADYRPFLSYVRNDGGTSLADEYFLVMWDMRGKGLSERFEAEDISFAVYLEDVEAVVDHFSPGRPVVFVAHSFGGTFAAQYMNAHPDRIAGAVLLEPGAFSSADVIVESDLKIYREWVNDLAWCHQFLDASSQALADFNMAALKCQQIQPEMHTSETTPFWRVGTVAQHSLGIEYTQTTWDFTEHLHEIEKEIVIVAGSKTERLGVEYQRRKLARFPSSRLEIVQDAGHGDLIWSRAGAVVSLIRAYLESLDLGEAIQ
jgi:proline iminopeptidase